MAKPRNSGTKVITWFGGETTPVVPVENWEPEPDGELDPEAYAAWGRKVFGEDWAAERESMIVDSNPELNSEDDENYRGRQNRLRATELRCQYGQVELPGKSLPELLAWGHIHYGPEYMHLREQLHNMQDQRSKVIFEMSNPMSPPGQERLAWLRHEDEILMIGIYRLYQAKHKIERQRNRDLIPHEEYQKIKVKKLKVDSENIVDQQLEKFMPEIRKILSMHGAAELPPWTDTADKFVKLEWKTLHDPPLSIGGNSGQEGDERVYDVQRRVYLCRQRRAWEDVLAGKPRLATPPSPCVPRWDRKAIRKRKVDYARLRGDHVAKRRRLPRKCPVPPLTSGRSPFFSSMTPEQIEEQKRQDEEIENRDDESYFDEDGVWLPEEWNCGLYNFYKQSGADGTVRDEDGVVLFDFNTYVNGNYATGEQWRFDSSAYCPSYIERPGMKQGRAPWETETNNLEAKHFGNHPMMVERIKVQWQHAQRVAGVRRSRRMKGKEPEFWGLRFKNGSHSAEAW